MIDLIGASGAIAAADNGDGTYTLTFGDGTSRLATAEELAAAARAAIKPVSARQMLLALDEAALLDSIEAYVATQPRAVQIAWQRSQEFQRTNEMLNIGAAALGMTDEQIDGLFALAATK